MSHLQIVQELYRAFAEKDYDAFLRICAADLEWIQNPGFPGGGYHQGAATVVEKVFKAFNDQWVNWKFEIVEWLPAGDSVVVIGQYSGTHRETGKPFRSDAAHVYDLADGKVKRFRQFADTKVIWDAMS